MKFKIAVVQLRLDTLSVEKMFRKIESYLKAASSRSDIIVFPEYVISWNFKDKGEFRKHFQLLAKKYKIDIVTGSMPVEQKNKTYNTSYYIDSNGKIKGEYKKINLWQERPYIDFGKKVCVFNTKFGKVGLTICWDIAFPEVYRSMVRKGARIVFCPAFWSNEEASVKGLKYNPKSEKLFIDACCMSRAFENEIIHIFCNAAGTVKEGSYYRTLTGHSQITIPFKGAIKKLEHNKEEMFIQEIDTAILKDAEKAYKIRRDLKKSLGG